MPELLYAVVASLIVSLISLIGVVALALKKENLQKMLLLLVGFSGGALLGAAFFHLLPEAAEKTGMMEIGIYTLIGFCIFFIIERVLHWHHCHRGEKCKIHMLSYMNLIGDGVHNFIDGLAIGASFFSNFNLGVATTVAIISHEIPQEIGDFGVLVYGGFGRLKALAYNLLSGLTSVIGAIIGFYLAAGNAGFSGMLFPFAAGGFIYIAASDLVPELHKEEKLSKSMLSFAMFALGIIFMYVVKIYLEA